LPKQPQVGKAWYGKQSLTSCSSEKKVLYGFSACK